MYLWTFAGLEAAHSSGFVLVEEAEGDGWGPVVAEQEYKLGR